MRNHVTLLASVSEENVGDLQAETAAWYIDVEIFQAFFITRQSGADTVFFVMFECRSPVISFPFSWLPYCA